MQISNSKT